MKKLNIIIILILLFILPLVSSDEISNLDKVKKGDSILLKQNCINVTYVNITSINVGGLQRIELLPSAVSMNLVYNGYQTYLFSNTTFLGTYIITGVCDENSIPQSFSYTFLVTPSGESLTAVQIATYIFFLFLCLVLTYFSVNLFKKNKMSKDVVAYSDLYKMKKRNNFLFYMTVLKKHLWIVGVFGIYLSILIFTALLEQLVYNLGLSDLDNILMYVNLFLAWGLIPFVIFWLAWLIIVFYQTTTETMRYQFGNIGGSR